MLFGIQQYCTKSNNENKFELRAILKLESLDVG